MFISREGTFAPSSVAQMKSYRWTMPSSQAAAPTMADPSLDALRDVQKACLLLVAFGSSSKELAPVLGLSHRTVDQYVNDAQHAVGAGDRREAARKLYSILDDMELKKLQQKFPGLAERLPGVAAKPLKQPTGRSAVSLTEVRRLVFPPPLRGDKHDLSRSAKAAEMIRAASFLAVAMLGLILFFAATMRLLS